MVMPMRDAPTQPEKALKMWRFVPVVLLCCGGSDLADQASEPAERLQSELGEGIRPEYPEMPQVRFSPNEIASIYYYLHGKPPESEYRRPQ
jgi:hypothetical protein